MEDGAERQKVKVSTKSDPLYSSPEVPRGSGEAGHDAQGKVRTHLLQAIQSRVPRLVLQSVAANPVAKLHS